MYNLYGDDPSLLKKESKEALHTLNTPRDRADERRRGSLNIKLTNKTTTTVQDEIHEEEDIIEINFKNVQLNKLKEKSLKQVEKADITKYYNSDNLKFQTSFARSIFLQAVEIPTYALSISELQSCSNIPYDEKFDSLSLLSSESIVHNKTRIMNAQYGPNASSISFELNTQANFDRQTNQLRVFSPSPKPNIATIVNSVKDSTFFMRFPDLTLELVNDVFSGNPNRKVNNGNIGLGISNIDDIEKNSDDEYQGLDYLSNLKPKKQILNLYGDDDDLNDHQNNNDQNDSEKMHNNITHDEVDEDDIFAGGDDNEWGSFTSKTVIKNPLTKKSKSSELKTDKKPIYSFLEDDDSYEFLPGANTDIIDVKSLLNNSNSITSSKEKSRKRKEIDESDDEEESWEQVKDKLNLTSEADEQSSKRAKILGNRR